MSKNGHPEEEQSAARNQFMTLEQIVAAVVDEIAANQAQNSARNRHIIEAAQQAAEAELRVASPSSVLSNSSDEDDSGYQQDLQGDDAVTERLREAARAAALAALASSPPSPAESASSSVPDDPAAIYLNLPSTPEQKNNASVIAKPMSPLEANQEEVKALPSLPQSPRYPVTPPGGYEEHASSDGSVHSPEQQRRCLSDFWAQVNQEVPTEPPAVQPNLDSTH